MSESNKLNELLEDIDGSLEYYSDITDDMTTSIFPDFPDDNGVDYPNGVWEENWKERCNNIK